MTLREVAEEMARGLAADLVPTDAYERDTARERRDVRRTTNALLRAMRAALEEGAKVAERPRPRWDEWGHEYRQQREIGAEIVADELRALARELENGEEGT